MVILDLGLKGRLIVTTNQPEPVGNDPVPTPTRLQLLSAVGRIVHYVSLGSADGQYPATCRAAIITDAPDPDGTASLCVLNPAGVFFNVTTYDPAGSPGTWHYPERV